MLLHFDTCCWSPKIQRTADGSCHLPTTLLATCWRGSAEKCARYSQPLVPVVELANQACHHLSSDPGQLTSREENVCQAQLLWFCPDDQDQVKKVAFPSLSRPSFPRSVFSWVQTARTKVARLINLLKSPQALEISIIKSVRDILT